MPHDSWQRIRIFAVRLQQMFHQMNWHSYSACFFFTWKLKSLVRFFAVLLSPLRLWTIDELIWVCFFDFSIFKLFLCCNTLLSLSYVLWCHSLLVYPFMLSFQSNQVLLCCYKKKKKEGLVWWLVVKILNDNILKLVWCISYLIRPPASRSCLQLGRRKRYTAGTSLLPQMKKQSAVI